MSQFYVNSSSVNPPPPPSNVATLYIEDTGTATPAENNLNVIGGTGITTAGSGSTITINVKNGGFTWIETSTNLAIPAQTGVFCTAALTITLPPALATGITVIIYADTASTVTIQAASGQMIQFGNQTSISTGSITSTAQGNIVELVYRLTTFLNTDLKV